MASVKEALFEEARYRAEYARALKEKIEEDMRLLAENRAKYRACYSVIVRSGLEAEYEHWKAEREEGKENDENVHEQANAAD